MRWLTAVGVTDVCTVAVEYDEFQDERLAASLAEGEAAVTALAETVARERNEDAARAA